MLWLRLSKLDYMRCFVDKHAREAWIGETNIKLMEAEQSRVASFNEHLSILEPTAFVMGKFENVSSVNDVPEVWWLSRDEKVQMHLGKRYAVDARISWSDSDEPNVDPTVWVHGLSKSESGHSRMAKVHYLNDYQKRFLREHCFYIGASSPCHGKVYLSIEWSPKMPVVNLAFVNLEFVGVSFHKVEGSMAMDSCLDYMPRDATLEGKLVNETFAGPPNYRSVAQGDAPETFWILHLVKSLCVNKGTDRMNEAESNIRKVQLLMDDDKYNRFRDLVGRHVSVKGKLSHSFTIHHREKVLLRVIDLSPAPPGTALNPTDIEELESRVGRIDWFKQQFYNAASIIDRLTQRDYTPTSEE